MRHQENDSTAALEIFEGIIVDHPLQSKGLGGRNCATFSMKPMGPVGTSMNAQNSIWQVVVYRQSSVGTLSAAEPGDIIEIEGRVQNSEIIVPYSAGRLSYLSPG